MMHRWDYIRRSAVRLLAMIGARVMFTAEERDVFLQSRVWLALRHEVAFRLDRAFDTLTKPDTGPEATAFARGAVWSLQWLLEPELALERNIAKDSAEAEKTLSAERKLREILELAERKKKHARRTD
jgi:hypothetical protein